MARSTSKLSRRRFVQRSGGLVTLLGAPAILKGLRADAANLNGALFPLGVASGDPASESVVLWTRLSPEPLDGGGMPDATVEVAWEVAADPGMAEVIQSGTAAARPQNGHAVQVLAGDLPPDSWLYYRFHAMGESSRVGRTRTFPPKDAATAHMRFGLVSCQDFRDGFYPAYRDLAAQELDFVVHVGDYIYENGATGDPIAEGRNHFGGEAFSVRDYRDRYSLYRLDPDQQEAHARFPFIVTWDDHEVDNNYAGRIAEEGAPSQGDDFLKRRLNAYRVYSETMPLRPGNRLHDGSDMRLFRRLQFGDLADIHLLDTRQFRSDQPAEDGFGSTDPNSVFVETPLGEVLFDAEGILDPNATLLGAQQEAWLARGLKRSRATWNVLAQQIMMTEWNLEAFVNQAVPGLDIADILNVDAWDGYQAARRRLFDVLARTRPSNPVVLSGDIHSAWGANLLDDFSDETSDMLAAEFVCTGISSTFGGRDPRPTDQIVRGTVLASNPHVEFYNGLYRGYCLCDVTAARWQTTYRGVGTLADLANPDPLALVPFEDSVVETDAVVEIDAGFNTPGNATRLETTFARVPLGV